MRVLFQNRPDMFKVIGGDTIQLLKTKEYLEKLGVEVDISLELRPNLDKYDLVHLFNITRVHETYIQAINAHKQNKPIVLSPIYWNKTEFLKKNYPITYLYHTVSSLPNSNIRKILTKFSKVKDILTKRKVDEAVKVQRKMGFKTQQIEVLNLAHIILPNSHIEAELIKKDFGVSDSKLFVVPNAVDRKFSKAKKKLFVEKFGIKDFVLSVGRIEKRKNTLSLIRAANEEGLPLVLIGLRTSRKYTKLCEKEAKKGDVIFLDPIPHDDPLLPSAYAAAKVHALVSWYETPGLVSLEAALAGANIVTTDRGTAREYFKDMAWYCDPSDLNSIRKALREAYNSKKTKKLKLHILKNYTWEVVAEKTLEAYNRVLSKC